MASDRVSCNNEKDLRYIARYQVDRETMIPMFIKAPRNIFGVSQYDKNSVYTMSFSASELKERVPHYRSNWNKFESKLRKKLATEPMKGESKYMKG